MPALAPPGRAGVLGPTYNEHAAAFAAGGWRVEEVRDVAALRGFDAAVVVNPEQSRRPPPDARGGAGDSRLRTGCWWSTRASPTSSRRSRSAPGSAGRASSSLRSFGKFYGLAGLRLGFALGAAADIARLRALAGPWPVSGPALAAGRAALGDAAWAAATRSRLAAGAARLDALAASAGWRPVGRHRALPALRCRRRRGGAAAARGRAHLVAGVSLVARLDPPRPARRRGGVGPRWPRRSAPAQQVGVHDPAVRRRGPPRGRRRCARRPRRAARRSAISSGHAEVGAPVDRRTPRAGRPRKAQSPSSITAIGVGVGHRLAQPPAGGDMHRAADGVERDARGGRRAPAGW